MTDALAVVARVGVADVKQRRTRVADVSVVLTLARVTEEGVDAHVCVRAGIRVALVDQRTNSCEASDE